MIELPKLRAANITGFTVFNIILVLFTSADTSSLLIMIGSQTENDGIFTQRFAMLTSYVNLLTTVNETRQNYHKIGKEKKLTGCNVKKVPVTSY